MTGCERILARLERGPATAAELYAETFTVVHSRISDLRKRGYIITCEHTGGHEASSYLYRLLDRAECNDGREKTSDDGVSPHALRSVEQVTPPQEAPSHGGLLVSTRDLILDRVHDDPAKAADARAYIKRRVEIDDQGCWIWTGALQESGYPIGSACNTVVRAHRLSYTVFVGQIPIGLTLDHTCRIRRCVNPAHLEPVTQRENTLRGDSVSAVNSRKTHCKSGHEFTPQNTRVSKRGQRHCLICEHEFRLTDERRAKQRVYSRAHKAREKAAACSPLQLELTVAA